MAVAEAQEVAQIPREIPLVTDGSDHLYTSAESIGDDDVAQETVAGFVADADFFYALQQLSVCCGREDRPILAGVFVTAHESGEGLELVVTDTYRLWKKHVPAKDVKIQVGIPNGLTIPKEFIKKTIPQIIKENGGKRGFGWKAKDVPFEVAETTTIKTYRRRTRRMANMVNSVIDEHDDLVRVKSTHQKLLVGMGGQYETFLVDGLFVNYTRVCPKDDDVKCTVDLAGNALAPALAFCGAVADRNDARVMLQLDEEGTLTIRAAYYESLFGAKAEAEYPIKKVCQKGSGDVWIPFKIGLNYQYMLDFIDGYPGWIELRFHGQLSSFVMKKGDDDYYVLMPMQMFDAAGNAINE